MARHASLRSLTLLLLVLAAAAAGPLRTALALAGRSLAQHYPAIAAIEILLLHRR